MTKRNALWQRMSLRVTLSEEDFASIRGKAWHMGILLGVYQGSDVADDLTIKYRGQVLGPDS